MDLDEWYNKVWLGQQDSYTSDRPLRRDDMTYQATTGSLPSYHTERMSPTRVSQPKRRVSPMRGSQRSPPKRRVSPMRASAHSDVRSHPGSASSGRYTSKQGPFCGPAGGAAAGTFPVKDFEHIRNALSRARNAPNPEGVRTCACARAQSLGLKGHFPSCPMNT